MSKIEGLGSKSTGSGDWTRAWEGVSRLAAASAATLPEVEEPQLARFKRRARVPPSATDLAFSPMAHDQLARDIAEIERAAAALRRAEPSLEPRLPNARPRACKMRSVWYLVGVTWLSVASVVSCAIGAIVLLFG